MTNGWNVYVEGRFSASRDRVKKALRTSNLHWDNGRVYAAFFMEGSLNSIMENVRDKLENLSPLTYSMKFE